MTPPELNHSGSLIRRGGLIEAVLPERKQRVVQDSIGRLGTSDPTGGIGERGRREAVVKVNVKADGWEGLD